MFSLNGSAIAAVILYNINIINSFSKELPNNEKINKIITSPATSFIKSTLLINRPKKLLTALPTIGIEDGDIALTALINKLSVL